MTDPDELEAIILAYHARYPKHGLITTTVTFGSVPREALDSAIEEMAIAWRRLFVVGFRNLALGYAWKLEATYDFWRQTFFPHRHALICVSPLWFHGLQFTQSGRGNYSQM